MNLPQRCESLAIPGACLLDFYGIDRIIPAENEEVHFPFPNRLLSLADGAKSYFPGGHRSRRAYVFLRRLEDLNFGAILGEVLEFNRRLPHDLKAAIHDFSDAQVSGCQEITVSTSGQ